MELLQLLLTLCLCYNTVLLIRHELGRHMMLETPMKIWQVTSTVLLRVTLTSIATTKESNHMALFWQFLCNHCLWGEKQPLSQPQPKLITGLAGAVCSPHSWNAYHHKPLTVRWKKNDEVWHFHSSRNMTQIPDMFYFFCLFSPLDSIKVQPATTHHCLFMHHKTKERWKSSKGLTLPPQITLSTIIGYFIGI